MPGIDTTTRVTALRHHAIPRKCLPLLAHQREHKLIINSQFLIFNLYDKNHPRRYRSAIVQYRFFGSSRSQSGRIARTSQYTLFLPNRRHLELHNTPYFCQTEDTSLFDLAEPIPGPSTGFYSEIASAYHIVLVTSLFERRAPGLYHNTAVVFDTDGSIAGIYRKMHIPDDPAYYEKFYFTPGDIGFEPIQTSIGKLIRRTSLLGPMVSRRSTAHGTERG